MALVAANEGSILKPMDASEKAPGLRLRARAADDADADTEAADSTTSSSSSARASDAPAAARPRSAPVVRTGVIHVSPLLRGVLVDGRPHRVHGGSVVVQCGRRVIKAPNSSPHAVVVPCGGSTSI
jgi:hypothetical protein